MNIPALANTASELCAAGRHAEAASAYREAAGEHREREDDPFPMEMRAAGCLEHSGDVEGAISAYGALGEQLQVEARALQEAAPRAAIGARVKSGEAFAAAARLRAAHIRDFEDERQARRLYWGAAAGHGIAGSMLRERAKGMDPADPLAQADVLARAGDELREASQLWKLTDSDGRPGVLTELLEAATAYHGAAELYSRGGLAGVAAMMFLKAAEALSRALPLDHELNGAAHAARVQGMADANHASAARCFSAVGADEKSAEVWGRLVQREAGVTS